MDRHDSRGRKLSKGEYERKDGSYGYRYIDEETGDARWAYAQSLAALRKKEKAVEKRAEKGVVRKGSTTSLDQAFDLWVEKRRVDVASNLHRGHTLDNYIYLWNTEVRRSRLGRCKVSKLTKELIEEHYKSMRAAGVSIGTIETVHTPLSQVVKFAQTNGWCKTDVSRGACAAVSKQARERDEAEGKDEHPKCLENEEKAALLDELKDPRWRHWAPIVKLLLHTGLRASELCGLLPDDVGEDSIWVRRSLGYKHDEYGHMRFVDGPPKTAKSRRELLLTDDAKNDLEEWRSLGLRCEATPCGLVGLVFCTPRGCALTYAAINKQLHAIARSANKKAGREVVPEGLTCHWMRHSFITNAIDAGVPAPLSLGTWVTTGPRLPCVSTTRAGALVWRTPLRSSTARATYEARRG